MYNKTQTEVAKRKFFLIFIPVMWIITAFYYISLMRFSKPSVVGTHITQNDMDEFYRNLKESFDQYLKDLSGEELGNLEEENTMQGETEAESLESSLKLKRDSSMTQTMAQEETFNYSELSSTYPCDRYEKATHTCSYVRQIGTTLTLGVTTGSKNDQFKIRWFRYFKRRNNSHDLKEEFTKEKTPWNVNIGGNYNELRISPITETDFSYNYFVATVERWPHQSKKYKKDEKKRFIRFRIEPINIDMGMLYPGEELVIYARSFMELPIHSVSLEWSLSDTEYRTKYDLPSNMKINADGSSVIVKELRAAVDKILTCSVFSNHNVFVAGRSFLFRKRGHENKNPFSIDSNQSVKQRRKRSYEENEGFLVDEKTQDKWNDETDNRNYHFSDSNNLNHNQRLQQFPINRNKDDRKNSFYSPYENTIASSNGFESNVEKNYYDIRSPSVQRTKNSEVHKDQVFLEKSPMLRAMQLHPSGKYKTQRIKDNLYDNLDDLTGDNLMSDDQLSNNDELSLLDEENTFKHKKETKRASHLLQNELIKETGPRLYEPKPDKYVHSGSVDENSAKLTFDDLESMAISSCLTDSDCSVHAICQKKAKANNFCKCSFRYSGNGIFCWSI